MDCMVLHACVEYMNVVDHMVNHMVDYVPYLVVNTTHYMASTLVLSMNTRAEIRALRPQPLHNLSALSSSATILQW